MGEQKKFIINTMSEDTYLVLSAAGQIGATQLNIVDDDSVNRTVVPSYDLLKKEINTLNNVMMGLPENTVVINRAETDKKIIADTAEEVERQMPAGDQPLNATAAVITTKNVANYYTVVSSAGDTKTWQKNQMSSAAFIPMDYVMRLSDYVAPAGAGTGELSGDKKVPSLALLESEISGVRADIRDNGLSCLSVWLGPKSESMHFGYASTGTHICSVDTKEFLHNGMLNGIRYDRLSGDLSDSYGLVFGIKQSDDETVTSVQVKLADNRLTDSTNLVIGRPILAEINKKVDSETRGEHGVGKIFNEGDGGGSMFVGNGDFRVSSYVGVNDGNGETSGIMGQLYVVSGDVRTKLNMYKDMFCYVKGDNPTDKSELAKYELAVTYDVSCVSSDMREADKTLSEQLTDTRTTLADVSADYLTSSDKAELAGAIADKVDLTALELSVQNLVNADTTKADLTALELSVQNLVNADTTKADLTALDDYYTKSETGDISAQIVANDAVTVAKLATAEGTFFATYVVRQNGMKVGDSINIPRDFLVKSGEVKTCDEADKPISGLKPGDKYLDFTVNAKEGEGEESHIYIDVRDLTDVYTGVSTDVISVGIGKDNKISADIIAGSIGDDCLSSGCVTMPKLSESVSSFVTGQYTSATAYVDIAISGLSVAEGVLSGTAGQTVTGITEENGIVSAVFCDISISHTQVSDWDTETGEHDKELYRTIYAEISDVTNPSVDMEVAICAIYKLAAALSSKF